MRNSIEAVELYCKTLEARVTRNRKYVPRADPEVGVFRPSDGHDFNSADLKGRLLDRCTPLLPSAAIAYRAALVK